MLWTYFQAKPPSQVFLKAGDRTPIANYPPPGNTTCSALTRNTPPPPVSTGVLNRRCGGSARTLHQSFDDGYASQEYPSNIFNASAAVNNQATKSNNNNLRTFDHLDTNFTVHSPDGSSNRKLSLDDISARISSLDGRRASQCQSPDSDGYLRPILPFLDGCKFEQ